MLNFNGEANFNKDFLNSIRLKKSVILLLLYIYRFGIRKLYKKFYALFFGYCYFVTYMIK